MLLLLSLLYIYSSTIVCISQTVVVIAVYPTEGQREWERVELEVPS